MTTANLFGQRKFAWNLEVDVKGAGFRGRLDYAIGTVPNRGERVKPVLIVLEAKGPQKGVQHPECVAQMVAELLAVGAPENNHGQRVEVFGILTDAEHWAFYRMDENKQYRIFKTSFGTNPHDKKAQEKMLGYVLNTIDTALEAHTPQLHQRSQPGES